MDVVEEALHVSGIARFLPEDFFSPDDPGLRSVNEAAALAIPRALIPLVDKEIAHLHSVIQTFRKSVGRGSLKSHAVTAMQFKIRAAIATLLVDRLREATLVGPRTWSGDINSLILALCCLALGYPDPFNFLFNAQDTILNDLVASAGFRLSPTMRELIDRTRQAVVSSISTIPDNGLNELVRKAQVLAKSEPVYDIITHTPKNPVANVPFVIVWDPKLMTPAQYAKLVQALGDTVRAGGGLGVQRIREQTVEVKDAITVKA